jgi:hypothetical protein
MSPARVIGWSFATVCLVIAAMFVYGLAQMVFR